MKKVAEGHDFSGLRPREGGGGRRTGGSFRIRYQERLFPISQIYFTQFSNHFNLNSTTILSILFLHDIYKSMKELLSILVFFYHGKEHFKLTNKQKSIDLGWDTFLISLNLIALHFNL